MKLPLEQRLIQLGKTEDERAEALHEKLIKIDLHCHGIAQFPFTYMPTLPLSPPPMEGMPVFPDGKLPTPLPKEVTDHLRALRLHIQETYLKNYRIHWEGLKQSGVTCIQLVLGGISEEFERCIYQLGFNFADIQKNPLGKRAYCAEDIRTAKREGKIAFMAASEANPFANNVERVTMLYGIGFRQAGMTYEQGNYSGTGFADERNTGLSHWGEQILEKMNELGMIADISHAGRNTAMDVINKSRSPVTLSHNGAIGVYPKGRRCRDDDMLKTLAGKKGVIGISGVPNALSGSNRQGVKNWFDHADYCVKLIGIDHVCVGTDINWEDHVGAHKLTNPLAMKQFPTDYMEGFENPTEAWHNVIRILVAEGYSDQEIEKIAGGNALSFIERVVG